MQKVCSFYGTAYKTTIFIFFPHGTYWFTIAYVLYLAFEEGSPFYLNKNFFRSTFLATLLSLTLFIESLLIYFPKATKIFQFTSFSTRFLLEFI